MKEVGPFGGPTLRSLGGVSSKRITEQTGVFSTSSWLSGHEVGSFGLPHVPTTMYYFTKGPKQQGQVTMDEKLYKPVGQITFPSLKVDFLKHFVIATEN